MCGPAAEGPVFETSWPPGPGWALLQLRYFLVRSSFNKTPAREQIRISPPTIHDEASRLTDANWHSTVIPWANFNYFSPLAVKRKSSTTATWCHSPRTSWACCTSRKVTSARPLLWLKMQSKFPKLQGWISKKWAKTTSQFHLITVCLDGRKLIGGLLHRANYKDYSMESRLHFRIHAALNTMGTFAAKLPPSRTPA